MKKQNLEILKNIKNKHGLEFILLHGSHVSGKIHSKSDVDIAVLPKKGTEIRILDLIPDFAEIYPMEKIDITDLSKADPLLLFAITKKSRLLVGKKKDYRNLKLKAFKRYVDYLPYLELESDIVEKNLKKFL